MAEKTRGGQATEAEKEAEKEARMRAEWRADFEAAARRPLETRLKYAFIHTYKPVLDDARFRSFDTMEAYREWCNTQLPKWLGYGTHED